MVSAPATSAASAKLTLDTDNQSKGNQKPRPTLPNAKCIRMHGTEAKLDDRKDQRNWLQKGGKNMKKNNKNSVQRVSCRVPLERSRPFTDPGAPFHAGDVWRPFSKPRKRTQKTTPAAGYGHRTRWMNHRSSSLRWPVSAGLSGFFLSPPTAASRRPPPQASGGPLDFARVGGDVVFVWRRRYRVGPSNSITVNVIDERRRRRRRRGC